MSDAPRHVLNASENFLSGLALDAPRGRFFPSWQAQHQRAAPKNVAFTCSPALNRGWGRVVLIELTYRAGLNHEVGLGRRAGLAHGTELTRGIGLAHRAGLAHRNGLTYWPGLTYGARLIHWVLRLPDNRSGLVLP